MTTTVGVAADVPLVPREWPAWGVPPRAVGEWLLLQAALVELGGRPACAVDPAAWWVSAATPAGAARQRAAAAECGRCAVVEVCAAYAVAAGERDGVWGGLTPAERRAL